MRCSSRCESRNAPEWKAIEGQKRKHKYRIARADSDLVTLAGLYDRWHRSDDVLETYTILTTAPNTLIETIYNRMPVVLRQSDEGEWLDPVTSIDTARAMCIRAGGIDGDGRGRLGA